MELGVHMGAHGGSLLTNIETVKIIVRSDLGLYFRSDLALLPSEKLSYMYTDYVPRVKSASCSQQFAIKKTNERPVCLCTCQLHLW